MLNKEQTSRMTKTVALIVAISFILYFVPLITGSFGTPSATNTTSSPSTPSPPSATKSTKINDLVGQGDLNFNNKNYAQAESYYKQALDLDPTNLSAQSGLGAAQLLGGKTAAAYASLKDALKIDSQHAGSLFYLGEAAAGLGKTDESKTSYNKYLEIAPTGEHAAEAKAALAKLGG